MWNKRGNDAVLRKAGGREDVIIGCFVQPQWGKSSEKRIWKEWGVLCPMCACPIRV